MNFAIIGYGGMASWHAELMKRYSKENPYAPIVVVGVYDIDEERIEVALKQGYKAYSSPEEIWADDLVESVLIATPNDLHCPYVKAAVKAGKNVICEKPVALSVAETEEMYDAAKAAGVLFEVHQNRRWDEDFLTVKSLVESGEIGDVYCVESRVMGANGIPGAWRKEKARGGGMMLDWGVHLLDQMCLMIPSKVESLYCQYSYIYAQEVDDGFSFTANFENGVKYRIVVATDCFRNLPRWQVYGTKGTATISDWGKSCKLTIATTAEYRKPEGINAGNGFTRTMAPRADGSTEEKEFPYTKAEPFAFYKNFVVACKDKEKAYIKREEVVRVFKLMEAATKSAEENAVIKERI